MEKNSVSQREDPEIKENSEEQFNDNQISLNYKNKKIVDKNKIPFIPKPQKDESMNNIKIEEIKNNHNDYEREDEIDSLINKIDKNKSKVTIESKAKLDFDDEGKNKKNNSMQSNIDIQTMFKASANIIANKIPISNKNNISISSKVNTDTKASPSKSLSKSVSNTPQKNINEIIHYNNKNQIINPFDVNKQDYVQNSDIILCVIELCVNTKDYSLKYKNKSRAFWEEILKKDSMKNIFANFKAETLKKYWMILSEVKDHQKIVEIVTQYKHLIDNEELKLLPVISKIVDHFKYKKEDIETSLSNLNKKDKKTLNFLGNKRDMEEEYRLIELTDLEKDLKKSEEETEDDPLLLDDATMELLLQDEQTKKKSITKEAPVNKNRVIFPNDKDKILFNDIDNIAENIQNYFNGFYDENLTLDEVLDILKKTSFNIESTYLYLLDKEKFKYLLFSDMEDYIVKNMRKSDFYKDLVLVKGKELVEEREKFLIIDDE